MSTVFLSRVRSSSQLDSYTGLPLEDDLTSTKSSPLLQQQQGGLTPPQRRTNRGLGEGGGGGGAASSGLDLSPLLSQVLKNPRMDQSADTPSRPRDSAIAASNPRDSVISTIKEGSSSLKELSGGSDVERRRHPGGRDEEKEIRRTSSFVDVLESRDLEMDKAWMDTQVP